MAILGYDTLGSSSVGLGSGRMAASRHTLAGASTLTELHGYFDFASGSDTVRVVIYKHVSGTVPDTATLVAYTNPVALTGGPLHVSQTGFSVALAAGDYWLGFRSSAASGQAKANNLGVSYYGIVSGVADPPPGTFGANNFNGVLTLSCWAVVTAAGGTTWFGGNTGSTDSVMGGNTVSGQSFTAPVSGNITQARGMLGTDTTNISVVVGVYANSGGVPGALLGQSDPLALTHPAAVALRSFTFTTPVPVVNGTSYFLVVYAPSTDSWKHRRDSSLGTTYYRTPVLGGLPNPFGAASTFAGFQLYLEAGIDPAAPTLTSGFLGFM